MTATALADPPTPATSARMRAMPTADTRPELALRSAMHALGLRWRNDAGRLVPGRPDICIPSRKVAVFVHGCYWHRCPAHYRAPRRNAAWWDAKIARNVARDVKVNAWMARCGWTCIRVWEHEDPLAAAFRVAEAWRALDRARTEPVWLDLYADRDSPLSAPRAWLAEVADNQ